jgi:hypothetical protein
MTLNVVLAVLEVQEDKVAHYAFINQSNIVTEVIVGKDENDGDIDWEQHYQEFRPGMTCKRTSYNTVGNKHLNGGTPFRKNYASIGYTYDPIRDAFIPPPPYSSWILNEDTCQWQSPIPYPTDGNVYYWDNSTQTWALMAPPTQE